MIRILAAGVLLAVVPFLGLPAFYESFLYLIFHWVVLATSWNILSGYSGYFSFGHAAFLEEFFAIPTRHRESTLRLLWPHSLASHWGQSYSG